MILQDIKEVLKDFISFWKNKVKMYIYLNKILINLLLIL